MLKVENRSFFICYFILTQYFLAFYKHPSTFTKLKTEKNFTSRKPYVINKKGNFKNRLALGNSTCLKELHFQFAKRERKFNFVAPFGLHLLLSALVKYFKRGS